MGNKKGNILVVVLVTLLIVSVGTVGYIFWQNQNLKFQATTPPTESIPAKATPISDEIGNWKTYIDSKYNFSFRYPNSWEFKQCADSLCGTFVERENKIAELDGFSNDCEVTSEVSLTNAEKAVRCHCMTSSPGTQAGCELTGTNISINTGGVSIFNFYLDRSFNGVIFFPKPVLVKGLLYEYGLNFKLLADAKTAEFNQILSSFKFLDQNPEGIFCGGIAGKSCAAGYTCQLDGNYPDSGGKCVKN